VTSPDAPKRYQPPQAKMTAPEDARIESGVGAPTYRTSAAQAQSGASYPTYPQHSAPAQAATSTMWASAPRPTRGAAKKGYDKAVALVPGVMVYDYVTGRGHARWARGPIVVTSLFAIAFLVALAFGYVLIPGILILIYVPMATRPPRGVIIGTQYLIVVALRVDNWQPRKVLERVPLNMALAPVSYSGKAKVQLGSERIAFRRRDYDRLVASAGAMQAAEARRVPQ
jgi:hypothetical protein